MIIPTVTVGATMVDSLDTIKDTLKEPFPQHPHLHSDKDIQGVLKWLKKMYGIKPPQPTTHLKPAKQITGKASRVGKTDKKDDEKYTGMNQYRPKKCQRFPLGT